MLKQRKVRDFINKEYINDDRTAEIDVLLPDSSKLFSPYSSKKMLNREILLYIDSIADPIPNVYPLIINFLVNDPDKINQEAVKDALKRYYWLSYQDKARFIVKRTILAIIMFILGIAAFLFPQYIPVLFPGYQLLEIFSDFAILVSWLFLWESITHFLIGRKELVLDRDNEKQMALAAIKFEQINENKVIQKEGETQ